jgi:hypothetical protein
MTVDIKRPLELVDTIGRVSNENFHIINQDRKGGTYFVVLPVTQTSVVMYANEHDVIISPGYYSGWKLHNKVRRVFVNFYNDGNAFYYETKEFAEAAHNAGIDCIGIAIPVDLPL